MNVKSFAFQTVYFCIGLLIIFFQILPLQTTPQTWSGPNVLLVFFAAIVTKRPEFTSSFLIAFIFLIEDFFSNAATRFDVILGRAWLLFFKKKISTSRRKPSVVWLGKCCNLLNSYSPTFLLYFSFVIYPISGIQINTYGNNSDIGSISNFFSAYW